MALDGEVGYVDDCMIRILKRVFQAHCGRGDWALAKMRGSGMKCTE